MCLFIQRLSADTSTFRIRLCSEYFVRVASAHGIQTRTVARTRRLGSLRPSSFDFGGMLSRRNFRPESLA